MASLLQIFRAAKLFLPGSPDWQEKARNWILNGRFRSFKAAFYTAHQHIDGGREVYEAGHGNYKKVQNRSLDKINAARKGVGDALKQLLNDGKYEAAEKAALYLLHNLPYTMEGGTDTKTMGRLLAHLHENAPRRFDRMSKAILHADQVQFFMELNEDQRERTGRLRGVPPSFRRPRKRTWGFGRRSSNPS